MSGHLHKSQLGSTRKLTVPPESHIGKPWWTTPPTAIPLQEHLDYAFEFRAQALRQKAAPQRAELLHRVNAWIAAANRLLRSAPVDIDGLRTDDELFLAAEGVIGALCGMLAAAGIEIAFSDERTAPRRDAVRRRALRAREQLRARQAHPSAERFRREVEP